MCHASRIRERDTESKWCTIAQWIKGSARTHTHPARAWHKIGCGYYAVVQRAQASSSEMAAATAAHFFYVAADQITNKTRTEQNANGHTEAQNSRAHRAILFTPHTHYWFINCVKILFKSGIWSSFRSLFMWYFSCAFLYSIRLPCGRCALIISSICMYSCLEVNSNIFPAMWTHNKVLESAGVWFWSSQTQQTNGWCLSIESLPYLFYCWVWGSIFNLS